MDPEPGRLLYDIYGNPYASFTPYLLDDLIDNLENGGADWVKDVLIEARENFRKDVEEANAQSRAVHH